MAQTKPVPQHQSGNEMTKARNVPSNDAMSRGSGNYDDRIAQL
eukprot:CAMPEP_0114578400 /NCGR_PEP_ID=MMETSP0125-20121206/2939_1 /TAXON_ID=485358 ORGANISM="Aristerostoma sp., Strain ATCC 50986" /NCGR_SAMPLE_ID=MMETSP0125 /ASSEMBLY_ACC=CAM_ASM_000245 /LENGTH=42 /DNA_ID= /DNA_START= /DNA_END= /DNA_ORIENTATION=